MPIQSAGLLLYRRRARQPQVLLIHIGGPSWAGKDIAAWSIPKGVVGRGEDPLKAASREFREETGFVVSGTYEPLGTFRQNSSKDLTVWSLEGDCDPEKMVSNTFKMVWPPKSAKMQTFPEANQAAWLDPDEALEKIVRGQRPVLQAFYTGMGPGAG
jgi:predicted NUDIX family NTP pyrophosphohydrolase